MKMTSYIQRILLGAFCLISLFSQAQTPPITRVSLVSEKLSVAPGSSPWIGVHFQLEPGWHIYWQNPGDAGAPPKIQWVLPTGWKIGSIEWPAPERLQNAAGVDYGYENYTTLLTHVQIPATARPGGTVYLKANLTWLICKDACVPQKGTASLTLSVGPTGSGDPTGEQLIEIARSKLPQPIPATWRANVLANPAQLLLNFRPGIKVNQAVFFPEEQQVIENAAPQKLSATSMRAQLALKEDAEARNLGKLKGVLVLNESEAYAIDLPIKTH